MEVNNSYMEHCGEGSFLSRKAKHTHVSIIYYPVAQYFVATVKSINTINSNAI